MRPDVSVIVYFQSILVSKLSDPSQNTAHCRSPCSTLRATVYFHTGHDAFNYHAIPLILTFQHLIRPACNHCWYEGQDDLFQKTNKLIQVTNRKI